jgi:hypothetical protein
LRLPACRMPAEWSGTGLQSLRMEVLRSAEQYVSLELLMDSVRQRRVNLQLDGGLKPAERDASLGTLGRIEAHIDSAQKLATIIRENDDSPGSYNTVNAVWCQSRLLLHLSACKIRRVRLRDQQKHQVPQTAMDLLGDAEATLRVADPQRHRSDLALVDLYRGEARLRLAESLQISMKDSTHEVSLADVCRELEQWQPLRFARESHEELLRKFSYLGAQPANLGHMQALVGDALRFLARAEPVLRERRRNVWWTTWFFERKLRAIALSVWLSVLDRKGPIPFLGFEAAAHGLETDADALVDIGTRMIRVDAYRLATIVEAYMSCAKALQIRLLADDALYDSQLYVHRRQRMATKLSEAVSDLDKVITARNSLVPVPNDSEAMDSNIAELVKAIRDRCDQIAQFHLHFTL